MRFSAVHPESMVIVDVFPARVSPAQQRLPRGISVGLADSHTVRICVPVRFRPDTHLVTRAGGFTLELEGSRYIPHYRHLVTHSWSGEDLTSVCKVLARELNRNCYLEPGLGGKVTAEIIHTPVEGALSVLLKMQTNNFRYVFYENNIAVGTWHGGI